MDDRVSNGVSDDGGSPPRVPDHDLIRPIGKGGFGQVWLAANRATGHLRAVKLISLHHSGETDPASREITSLTRLEENLRTQHANLLSIHHVGKTADHLFYVMDPADDVSGTQASSDSDYRPATLESRLQSGPLLPQECLRHTQQLLAGLASLHEAGMVHRDVKPANCLFVTGQLKLADFGLVTAANPQVSRVGTRKYMPPDGQMDTRADVYAAGLVIYEMITGLPAEAFPCLGDRTHEVARDPILAGLNRLVLRACEPDPDERFQDARAMLAELIKPGPRPATGRRRLRRRTIIALACGLAALCWATTQIWPDRPSRTPPGAVSNGVEVNFISVPFEATIYLDGVPLQHASGEPYRTPCTVSDLPAGVHHVVFKHDKLGELDAGEFDFAETHEIEVLWTSEQAPEQ